MAELWLFRCPDHEHDPEDQLIVAPLAIDWVITHNGTDHPDKVVVRRHAVGHGPAGDDLHMIVAAEPSAIVDTVSQARAVIPEGAELHPRSQLDAPVIVETWRVFY